MSTDKLTVLAFNVNFCRLSQASAAVIAKSGADVVCLVESTPDWQELLSVFTDMDRRYPYSCFHHARGAGGLACYSVYPIEGDRLEPLQPSAGWDPGGIVRVRVPFAAPASDCDGDGEEKQDKVETNDCAQCSDPAMGTLVQFVLVHLRPPVNAYNLPTPWAIRESDQQRLADIKHFLAAADPLLPTVLLGDFNERAGSAVRYAVERALFRSALAEHDPGRHTWHWKCICLCKELTDTFDHILYDTRLSCSAARVLQRGRSDHYPVEAVLHWRPLPAHQFAEAQRRAAEARRNERMRALRRRVAFALFAVVAALALFLVLVRW